MGFLEQRANLAGKVAAVVGGAKGIGGAVTTALAAAGVDVAVCDVDADALAHTHAEVDALGRRASTHVADALDADQLEEFFAAVDRDLGRLDVLVNVVGGAQRRWFAKTTPDDWAEQIHRNYGWAIHSTHLAVTRMRAGGRGGSIISFTTIEAHRGAATYAVYAGAKAGLTNFSRSLALELAPEGIRVNTIAPDATPSARLTEMLEEQERRAPGSFSPEARARAHRVYVPAGAPPSVDDLADVVLFLASDLSRAVTGTTLHADGGTWAASGFLHWPDPHGWAPSPPATLLPDDA
ncbi:MAG: SDR family oxidoreductase [Actinobacteria bacterium]|nr:SDR family oxidoreductase [Actinomycetota bacterium]